MAKNANVVLGEREFVIRELPTKPAEKWRQRLGEEVAPLLGLIQQAPEMMQVEVNAETLPGLIDKVKLLALNSLPAVRELVISYSQALEAERAWLEENACDSEFIDAFVEVLKLAFPFGSLAPVLTRAMALGQKK